MTGLSTVVEGFSCWIDTVAGVAATWRGRLGSRRVVVLTEVEKGEFTLSDGQDSGAPDERIKLAPGGIVAPAAEDLSSIFFGSHVDLVLRPERFVSQPLDLPSRANEFLDGVVRAQIDRLTPWRASEAAFGWSDPVETVAGRIEVTVVAAPLASVAACTQAIMEFGAQSVSVFTLMAGPAKATRIKIFEQEARGEIGQIRRMLLYTFFGAAIAAAAATASEVAINANLDAQAEELSRKIATVHVAPGSMPGSIAAAQRYKHDAPSSVVILEKLSRILPDHTYVTEFQVDGNKVKLVGVTRDAPSLIALLEQSGFARASFFAPTTRSPAEPGEHFNIEALVQLSTVPRS
jgi:general secretion pathway protein L